MYPQRIGPAALTPHRNMRMRYLLKNPEHLRGKRQFMHALTEHPEHGVEVIERIELWRVNAYACVMSMLMFVVAILVYVAGLQDWIGACTVAGE